MDVDDQIEKMILDGSLEICGIDTESGEFLYKFTNKMQQLYPDLYNEAQTHFSKEVMFLWENDFVSMDVTEKNPLVQLTEKAFNQGEISKLDKETLYTLNEIKRVLIIE